MSNNTIDDIHAKVKTHKGTFGFSKAGENLDIILNDLNDKHIISYVAKRINDWDLAIVQLRYIPNVGFRGQIASIYLNQIIQSIKDYKLPTNVESHLCNLLVTMKKVKLK